MALPILNTISNVAAGTASATKKVASTFSTQAPSNQTDKMAKQQSSFFDKMLASDRNNEKINKAKQATAEYLERQDKFVEQKQLLRRIANNTDTIVDLLRDFKGQSKDNGKSLLDMLKWLLPGLLALPAFLNPEKSKPYQAGTKAAIKAAPTAIKAAQTAAEAAKATKLAKAGEAGVDASKALKGVEALGTTAKVLGKIGAGAGKFADSKLVNNGLRLTSGAMAAGRAIQGDYTGAGMEVASQGLNEVARKVKNPKAKLALTLASLGTDAAIMGRDWFNGKQEQDRAQFAKDNGITAPEKESVITKLMGWAGVENDQAKRIKEQQAAITPDQQAVLDKYDSENKGIFGGGSEDNISTITKIITGVTLGILAGLGIKSLLSKKLGIDSPVPDVTMPDKGGKTYTQVDPKTKTKGPFKPGFKPQINSIVPLSTVANGADDVAKEAGKKVLTKGAGKAAAKLIPGVGLAMGAYGAYSRSKDGDYLGAALEGVSGIATMFPVVGTAIGGVIQGGLMYRDYVKATSQGASELNKISKDSAANLNNSAIANKKTVDANGVLISKTNDTLTKNSGELKKSVSVTGIMLKSFTGLLGTSLLGWIAGGSKIFQDAFDTLSNVSNKLWDWVKNSSLGQAVGGAMDSISGAIDTTSGQANLGKHGGTMTGSIFAGESGGNYGVYNVKQGNKYVARKADNNNLSLNTVTNMQSSGKMNAFGAYQIIGSTMQGAKKHLKLTGNEKMTQGLQDRIYQDYLVKEKRKDMYKYLTGGNNLNAAITAAAMEWASIGVPVAMKGDKRQVAAGESYYAGDGHNKASISPTEFGEGLKQQRNRYLALKKAGYTEQQAYKMSFDKNALNNAKNIKKEDKKGTGGDESGTVQKVVNGISDAGKAAGGWLAGTSVGKTISGALEGSDKGVDGRQPLSDKTATPAKQPIKKDTKANAAAAQKKKTQATDASKEAKKDDKKNTGNAEWDLDKLCSYAVANIRKDGKTGLCARYVTNALRAAQIKKFFSSKLGNANEMPPHLVKMGWVNVGSNLSQCKKGDIAVFQSTGSPEGKKHGHICIWTGAVWVSDHVQKSVQPNSGLGTFPYVVYRAKNGISNGTPVTASAAPGATGADALVGGGSDSETTEEKKNAGEKLIDGMAALMAWAGNTDTIKSAVDWLDSVKSDAPKQNIGEKVELNGYDKKLYKQIDTGFEYKGGNGGGVNEDQLFNPNLERQKGATQDLLGTAGKINGIQRQQDIGRNLLGEAGYVNPSIRQLGTKRNLLGEAGSVDPNTRQLSSKYDLLGEAGYVDPTTRQLDIGRNLLGEAGNGADFSDVRGTGGYGDLARNTKLDDMVKELEGGSAEDKKTAASKKKLKWYDKLFGDSNSWLGQLSNGLGFGKLFGFGQDIYKTSKNDEWGKYAMDKGTDILTKNGMGEFAQIGSDIYNTSQSGNGNDWGGAIARTLDTVYSHKDDHLKDANGNIITNDNSGQTFTDILNSTNGIVPELAGQGMNLNVPGSNIPGMQYNKDGTSVYSGADGRIVNIDSEGFITSIDNSAKIDAIDKPIIVPETPNSIAPAAPPEPPKENNIIPTVKEDTNGNRTFYNGDGSTVTRDVNGKIISQTQPTTDIPSRFDDVKPRKGDEIAAPASSDTQAANPALAAALANQSGIDSAFEKLRKDKVASGQITDKGPSVSLTPNNKLENGVLQPDMEGRATLDDHVAKVNRQYEMSKNSGAAATPAPVQDGSGTATNAASNGNKNGGAGNTAPIVTRNPDSIFRAVSMTMMQASTT